MATRLSSYQLQRNKRKAFVFRLLAAVLSFVLVLGVFSFVRTMSAVAAATSAVETAEEMLNGLGEQHSIDDAREHKKEATRLVEELSQGTTREELIQRLAQIRQILATAQAALDEENRRIQAEEQATEAVRLAESLAENISSDEEKEEADDAHNQARSLVEELHDGEAKETLSQQLASVLQQIEQAAEILANKKTALETVEHAESLTGNLSTQRRVNSAKTAHDTAATAVEILPDDEMKDELSGRLAAVKSDIDQAQEVVYVKAEATATKAVEKAESRIGSLNNWGTVSAAEEAYDEAMYLVHRMRRGSARTALLGRLSIVSDAIDAAQAKLREKERQAVLYTHSQMVTAIQSLASQHPDLVTAQVLGKSVAGKDIWALTLGTGDTNILIIGSLHGSEWVTTPVLIETIKQYVLDYNQDNEVLGHSMRHILDTHSITFIPMANPDGATLAQQGANAFPQRKEQLLAMNGPWGESFTRWKANISGVDLNRNFDVHWHQQPSDRSAWSEEPNYAFYPGPVPESEPETKIVANWARANQPVLFLDYHSYGEIIYWWYHQTGAQLERDRAIVRAMRDYSGFRMESVGTFDPMMSYSAYWGAEILGIPSATVEVGNRPPRFLNMNHVPDIMNQVRYLPIMAITTLPDYEPPETSDSEPPETEEPE